MDAVTAICEELMELTGNFLEVVQDGPPDEEAQALFWQARTDLAEHLRLLLADENRRATTPGQKERQVAAMRVEKLQRLAELDALVLAQLGALRTRIGEELRLLGRSRQGLNGYRMGLKEAPRFCQKTA